MEKKQVLGTYRLDKNRIIEIIGVDYDAMIVDFRIRYKGEIDKTIISEDIIDKDDGVYIDALGFMFGDKFIAFHNVDY